MTPQLPEWYVIPQEVVRICQHIQKTTGTTQPMRNFLLRGPAGTGKTESAKAIAAGLQPPYTTSPVRPIPRFLIFSDRYCRT